MDRGRIVRIDERNQSDLDVEALARASLELRLVLLLRNRPTKLPEVR